MITNNLFNKGGRLGNQMFQYATLLGVKYKKGYDIVLEEEFVKSSMLYELFDLNECILDNENNIKYDQTYIENCHCFDPNVLEVENNTNLRGYFQTEKYFEHCKDVIKSEFTFKDHIIKEVDAFLSQYKKYNLVSVHVRRTDYLSLSHVHGPFSIEYYNEAIDRLNNSDTYFIVTSDDIVWCRNNFQLENIVFSNNSMEFDLCLQSRCDKHIIANSTFSWWGAWLGVNPDKQIIAPSNWFEKNYQASSEDIVPLNWIKI
jgi:hypothetical protein